MKFAFAIVHGTLEIALSKPYKNRHIFAFDSVLEYFQILNKVSTKRRYPYEDRINLRINIKNSCWLLKFSLIWNEGLQTKWKSSPDGQPYTIYLLFYCYYYYYYYYLYYSQFNQVSTFLGNRSPYLFIFNPCIRPQLICPCVNFYFLLAVNFRLFLFCHLTLFLPIFPFYVPLEMLESLWLSGVSRGSGMEALVILMSINDNPI